MRILASHPGVPPSTRHLMLGLHRAGHLEAFATTVVSHPGLQGQRWVRRGLNAVKPDLIKQLDRRSFAELPAEFLRLRQRWMVAQLVSTRVLRRPALTDWLWERGDHDFDAWVAGQVHAGLDAVYAVEHAALATVRRARALGVVSVVEQPSQHHAFFDRVYREQIARYPEIRSPETDVHADPKTALRDARRDEELAEADLVLCNSRFTLGTLTAAGVPEAKVIVVPLGCPPPQPRTRAAPDRVVFLNAGTQNLRKGLHLLYRAWRTLAPSPAAAALWLVGKMDLPEAIRQGLPGDVRIQDSIPRADLLDAYQQASVFVLPTLADGFAMVVTEAMSRGVPVITTASAGAADLIEHGTNGWVVPAGDADALATQMQWCIDHPAEVNVAGEAALKTASRWQWADYERAAAEALAVRIAAVRGAAAAPR